MSRITTKEMKSSTILRINYDRGIIDTSPEYQRKSELWNIEKQQLLIDSILNDFDIPKLYFHAFGRPKKMPDGKEVAFAIIDGKQRLEAIWGFMDGNFPLSGDFEYFEDPSVNAKGMTYSDLGIKFPRLKVFFDSFVLPIVLVETDDIDLIEDMFSRLNESVPLNAAERRNALGGPMAALIRDVASHEFFKRVAFKDRRYQFREVSARVLFLEYSLSQGQLIDTKKAFLDNFVRKFKTSADTDPLVIANGVKLVFNEMKQIFVNEDPLLSSQSSVPIYFLLVKSAITQGRLPDVTRKKLLEFDSALQSNLILAQTDLPRSNYDLLRYYQNSIQGTNDAGSIRERLRILSDFVGIPVALKLPS